jgi:hypothetical protein
MWGGLAAAIAYVLYQKSQAAGGTCPNADMGGKNFGVKPAPAGAACCWTC